MTDTQLTRERNLFLGGFAILIIIGISFRAYTMQASESALHLVRLLFALERRWHPYHDQLAGPLRELEPAQGWGEGELADALLRVVRDADPTFQQALELRVEALMESRGIAHQWGPEDDLQPLKEHRFR